MVTLYYMVLGALAGLTAGLFGVGGGLIIVPALMFSYTLQDFPPEITAHLAVGTSLATIVVTSLSSLYSHHRKGAVEWGTFVALSPGVVLGTWMGVFTATQLAGDVLARSFGLFALLMAARMWFGSTAAGDGQRPSGAVMVLAGGVIGWISGLFGVGGGSMTVPFLRRYRVPMQRAVATSAACGIPLALTGALTNVVLGQDNPHLPELSSGYVYWPAFVGIVLTSVLFAKLGASLAHKLSAVVLQKLFALLLLVMGCKLLLSG